MSKKQFKAESKRLLDLMINSIYTNREIFLREIISNASDAIDKLCYLSLTDTNVGMSRADYKIDIIPDKESRTLTVRDNGIGMTMEGAKTTSASSRRAARSSSRARWTRIRPRARICPLSVSSASASIRPLWSRTRSPSSPASTARIWASSGESRGADGYTVTPARRRASAPTLSCT